VDPIGSVQYIIVLRGEFEARIANICFFVCSLSLSLSLSRTRASPSMCACAPVCMYVCVGVGACVYVFMFLPDHIVNIVKLRRHECPIGNKCDSNREDARFSRITVFCRTKKADHKYSTRQ